jgi:predicted enzyme related to lactoylglutathione lyase
VTGRDRELDRLLTLGATVVDDRRHVEGGGWVVLTDHEGNEFCLEGD